MNEPLLGVAALQLETRSVPTEENLAHTDQLLDQECQRLGLRRWDGVASGGDAHLDLLVLPEIFNAPYLVNEAAWHTAESLQSPARSPSLRALSAWAARYRCYVAATLLEATPDGHIYNSLVLAAPAGGFVAARPGGGIVTLPLDGAGGGKSSSSGSKGGAGTNNGSSGSSGSASYALVRKHRAASLEAFVFRSGGAAGRGGEPAAHVVELNLAPLLAKRRDGSVAPAGSGSAGGSGKEEHGALDVPRTLCLAFAICYENICYDTMDAILEAHRHQRVDLLVAPFCAMAARPDHPTFSWPREAAERFAAAAGAAPWLHAAKLRVHAVACHHCGPWESPLPQLLPLLPPDPVPLSGPMLGCSAIYAPGGAPLAQAAGPGEEGLLLARLPLLQRPPPAALGTAGTAALPAGTALPAGDGGAELAGDELAGSELSCSEILGTAAELARVMGAAAAASAAAGPQVPYARYPGGYVIEPPGWQMRWGFPIMEALGSFSYHWWRAAQRARVARVIAAKGSWQAPAPAPEADIDALACGGSGRGGWGRVALAGAVLGAAAAASVAWLRSGARS